MARLGGYSVGHVRTLQDRLRTTLRDASALDEASQSFARTMAEEFEKTVLARVFATIPYRLLPEANRTFVGLRAREAKIEALLTPELPVLSLMGTYGQEGAWRERALSKRFIGIPLASDAFTKSMPMISALLAQVGFDPSRKLDDDRGIRVDHLLGGQAAGVFHVDDASTAVDAEGRKIIPAQDFVADYEVKTVYGMGGSWPDGTFATCIVFSRESVDRAAVRRVAPIMSVFQAAATPLVARGKYFAHPK